MNSEKTIRIKIINKVKNEKKLKYCKCCKCTLLLEKYFRINRKGQYNKTCNVCLDRLKERREEKFKNKCFQCDRCDSNFSTNTMLQRHIKGVHDKIKDFECSKCDYKCSMNSDLKRHVKGVHDKIKDFECSKCDFKCSHSSHLKQHTKQVHDKLKDFECDRCDSKFSLNGNLQIHIKAVHDKIKDFECNKCDSNFSTNGSLKIHIKVCTGEMNCSSGEFKIMKILEKFNIDYDYNETYKVKHKSYLRWDFIIEINDEKAFIEYDGKQHFEPVCFGGISEEEALIAYDKCVLRDSLKNEFCEDHNLKLLRIPYYEKKNIEKLIKDFLKL